MSGFSDRKGFVRLTSALCLLGCFAAATGAEFTGAGKKKTAQADAPSLPMIDARINRKDAYLQATRLRSAGFFKGLAQNHARQAFAIEAIAQLRRRMPVLQVEKSAISGAVTSVYNPQGALTDPQPGRSSRDIVFEFLREQAAIYGLSSADIDDLVVLGDSPGGRSGLRMLRVQQQVNGWRVFSSETRFLLDREGRLIKSVGSMVATPRAAAKWGPSNASLRETLNKSLLDFSECAESGTGPHSATLNQALACSIRGAPSLARGTSELVQRFLSPEQAAVYLLAAAGHPAQTGDFALQYAYPDGHFDLAPDHAFVTGIVTAHPVWFPLAEGLLVPAWSLVMFTAGDQDWYAVVDAETGAVLWRKNIRAHASAHDARFRVYVQDDGITPADNPAPASPSPALPGNGTQFGEIASSLVSMHAAMDALGVTASPNGWIDDCPAGGCTGNETQTLGNNVLVCLDRTGGADQNTCDTDGARALDGDGRATGNPDPAGRNRDFLGGSVRDFVSGFLPPPQAGDPEAGQTASGDGAAQDSLRRGALGQVFYVANWYHDRMFQLGFDEAAGNFQQTNFSAMGVGNDRLQIEAQDNSGPNGESFSVPPDGVLPHIDIHLFNGPDVDRDASFDTELVLHELTHGTTSRLAGNATGLGWDPGKALGEGWSDFYALALLNNSNADDPNGRYAFGSYSAYKSVPGYTDNYVYGLRRFPYSTDNTINPLTWADVDDVTNDLSGGIAPSPLPLNANGGMHIHNAGELWALSLWEIRSRIIADPAGANGDVPTGNQTMLQLVTDALKMTPDDPTFIEARDALIAADCATHNCANEAAIWAGFADRGLGYGAAAPYRVMVARIASHMGIHESFDLPRLDVVDPTADIVIDDSIGNHNARWDTGETVQLQINLTNPWRAAGKAASGITATLASATPGVTVYGSTASYPAIAPQGNGINGTPFIVGLDTSVLCGAAADFTLTTVSSLGTTSAQFRVRIGTPNGTDPAITYSANPEPDLAIPDGNGRGVFDSLTVTDDNEIADLNLRIDSLTHTWTGDLTVMLRSPAGVGVDLLAWIGVIIDGGAGANIAGMTIDDDLPFLAANDMVQASAAQAPFTQSWLPVYNAPWPTLFPPMAADPIGNLMRMDGTSTQGNWTLLISDSNAIDVGTLDAWSIDVTPVHFDCAAFDRTFAVAAGKTVSGTFRAGGTVTYTVTLTNTGNAGQPDNPGSEFIDILPAGLTLIGAIADSGTVTANLATHTINWNGTIAPNGNSVTIGITATIDANTQGQTIASQGTALVDSDGDGNNDASVPTDQSPGDGNAEATSFVVANAQVSATKTVAGTFTPGGTVVYTIALSNSGNSAAPDNAGAELTDILPAGLALQTATASSGMVDANGESNTVTWNGSIPANGAVVVTIDAQIDANAAGTIANQATFAFDADLDGANESIGMTDDPTVGGALGGGDPTEFAVQGINLRISKTNGTGHLLDGATTVYSIEIQNIGPNAVTGAAVLDTLPVTLINASWICNATGTVCPVTSGNGAIDADNIDLPVGASLVFQLTATVDAGTAASVQNTATVSGPTGMLELDPNDNTAADTDAIVGATIFKNSFE